MNKQNYIKTILQFITILVIVFSISLSSIFANSTVENKKLNPGELITDHITNSHEWHLLTTPSGKHVSIPLPIIVYSSYSGLHIFMSSKFEHGHAKYKNLELATVGENKGKITEYDEEGRLLNSKPFDFSLTKNVIGLLVGLTLTFLILYKATSIAKERRGLPPKGILSAIEPLVVFIRDDVARPSLGPKADKFLPFLLSIFFMIFITNLTGLIPVVPFGANVSGNISVTLALALFTFLTININANQNYWKHIYNTPGVPWFMKFPVPIMPIVEFFGVFIKPLVLAVRLFANMMAGHIIVLAFICLIFIFSQLSAIAGVLVSPFTLIFVIFITVLELLVSFIQAYVFTLLSAIFIGMAVAEHH